MNNSKTMVLLGVDNIEEWENKIDIPNSIFIEPDMNNLKTAMAICPNNGKLFNNLKLL